MDLPIIILAAGASSRMNGADKLMQSVDGMPLIRRQAAMARNVTEGPVLVAVPPAPHARHDALAGLDVTLCPVPDADEGMNASLRSAIRMLPEGAPAVLLLLGDLPDITEDHLRTVLQAHDISTDTLIWRGATSDGKPGHPVIFDASLFPALSALSGDDGGKPVAEAARDKTVLVPLPGDHARADLDTPEAWEAWRARNPHRM